MYQSQAYKGTRRKGDAAHDNIKTNIKVTIKTSSGVEVVCSLKWHMDRDLKTKKRSARRFIKWDVSFWNRNAVP